MPIVRWEDAVAAGPASSPAAMLDYFKAELTAFVNDQDPHDDVTTGADHPVGAHGGAPGIQASQFLPV